MTLDLVYNSQMNGYEENHVINHDFTSTRLIIEIASSEASLWDWIRAGHLVEKVVEGGIESTKYCTRLNFGRTALIVAPFNNPYRLVFNPYSWVRDATIKMWEVT